MLASRIFIASLVALLFGLVETAAVFVLFVGILKLEYDFPILVVFTFALVYLALRSFAFLTKAGYRVKLWHALIIFVVGLAMAVTGAAFYSSVAEHWLEEAGRLYFAGMVLTFLLPVPILLIYDRLLRRGQHGV